jgi:hypothetical protein
MRWLPVSIGWCDNFTLEIVDRRIKNIYRVANPDKLTRIVALDEPTPPQHNAD